MRFELRGQTGSSLTVYYMNSHSFSPTSVVLDVALTSFFTLSTSLTLFPTPGTIETYCNFFTHAQLVPRGVALQAHPPLQEANPLQR